MSRGWITAAVAVVVSAAPVSAQAPALRFQWQPGQVVASRVVQATTVSETVREDGKDQPVTSGTETRLELVKRWQVKDVDAAGAATLELSIVSMKQEIKQPDGSATTLDSTTPEGAKQTAEFIGKPVLTVKVDARGQVSEVKEARPGSGGRLQAELPFRVTLPETGPAVGQKWDRPFAIKLDPPHGTGESYDAVQTFACKGANGGLTVVGVETALKTPPSNVGEQVPLVPMLWKGEVYFNTAAGRVHAVRLEAKSELGNHQGEGTKFVYQSQYAEDAVDMK